MSATKLTLLETIIKPFVNGWVEKRVKAREDALALLQNEKESMVSKAYEKARTMLIDTSAKFNPQRDIGYIQYMQKEYETVIEGENQFKKNQWSLIEQILVIFVALGLLKTETKYTQTSSTLLDDLHGFLQDAEAAKQIMQLGLPELPKTSGQYITESIRVYEDHRQMIQTALQQMKTRTTPEELEEQLLDVFCSKDREQGTVSAERVLSKEGINMVHEYRKLYETKYQEIEQRWDAAEQERKQLVVLLIKEAKSTGVTQGVALYNYWNELHVGELSDNELEEYGEKIKKEHEEINDDQENRKQQWKKLEHMMHQLLFSEGENQTPVMGWKINNDALLNEWTMIRNGVQKTNEEGDVIIEKLQQYSIEIEQEKTNREFEKMKQKYVKKIEDLKNTYELLEDQMRAIENEMLNYKVTKLCETLKNTFSLGAEIILCEITKYKQQQDEGKNNLDFKKKVEIAVKEKYREGSVEYILIQQGLFGVLNDNFYEIAGYLALQEQEGIPFNVGNMSPLFLKELDYIKKKRLEWIQNIANTDKPKEQLKNIADSMIRNNEFVLEYKAGILGGRFTLGSFNQAFGTSYCYLLNKSTIPYDFDFQNKHISLDDLEKRYITKKFKHMQDIDIDTIPAEQERIRSQHRIRCDYSKTYLTLIYQLRRQKGVTENDALAIYMYLTGQGDGCRFGYESHYDYVLLTFQERKLSPNNINRNTSGSILLTRK